MNGWKFTDASRRLRDGTLIEQGVTYKIDGDPILCMRGFHSSERAIDALVYGRGPIVSMGAAAGTIIKEDDKFASSELTVLAIADATLVLREFSVWCAERALSHIVDLSDKRSWDGLATKRRWLNNEATSQELSEAVRQALEAYHDAPKGPVEKATLAAAWATEEGETITLPQDVHDVVMLATNTTSDMADEQNWINIELELRLMRLLKLWP